MSKKTEVRRFLDDAFERIIGEYVCAGNDIVYYSFWYQRCIIMFIYRMQIRATAIIGITVAIINVLCF